MGFKDMYGTFNILKIILKTLNIKCFIYKSNYKIILEKDIVIQLINTNNPILTKRKNIYNNFYKVINSENIYNEFNHFKSRIYKLFF